MGRKRTSGKQKSHEQTNGKESRSGRRLLGALALAILVGALAYSWSRNSARSLARIRELGQRDPVAAMKLLDESGDRSPDGLLLRCRLLAAAGRWEQAEDAFDDIAKPDLCRLDELIDLARQAMAADSYSLVDKTLDAAYRQGNPTPQLLRTMIGVKYFRRADQEALSLCREMSTLAPRDLFPWFMSAQIYHDAEKIDLAIEAYREALQRDPSAGDARHIRFQIADLAIYAGDLDAAGQQLDQLATELPHDPDVGVLRARLLHRQGEVDASLRLLDEVLATKPDLVSALVERGVLHFERENFTDAVRDLKQAVTLAPENYTGHYKLGLAYQRLNQPDLAQRHLDRSMQITDQIAARKLLEIPARRASE